MKRYNVNLKPFFQLPYIQERFRQDIVNNPRQSGIVKAYLSAPRVIWQIQSGVLRVQDELPYLNPITLSGLRAYQLALIELGFSVREVRNRFITRNHAKYLLEVEGHIRTEIDQQFADDKKKKEEALQNELQKEQELSTYDQGIAAKIRDNPKTYDEFSLSLDQDTTLIAQVGNKPESKEVKQEGDNKAAKEVDSKKDKDQQKEQEEFEKSMQVALRLDAEFQRIKNIPHFVLHLKYPVYWIYNAKLSPKLKGDTPIKRVIRAEAKKMEEQRMLVLKDRD
jgi:hypothetical protein